MLIKATNHMLRIYELQNARLVYYVTISNEYVIDVGKCIWY
jgi:hypothetical protein